MPKQKRKVKLYAETAKIVYNEDPYNYQFSYTFEDENLINVKPKAKPKNKYKS